MNRTLKPIMLFLECLALTAGAESKEFHRRLLLECPEVDSDQFAVELSDLLASSPLVNVVSVVDAKDDEIPWVMTRDRKWLRFDAKPGERCEILVSTNSFSPPRANSASLSGQLTVESTGILLRKSDYESRSVWLSNRVCRVMGAALEKEPAAAVEAALKAEAQRLKSFGIMGTEAARPRPRDISIIERSPDFSHALRLMLDCETQARAAIFITAQRVLNSNNEGIHGPATTAMIRTWDTKDHDSIATRMRGKLHFAEDTSTAINIYSVFGGMLKVDGRIRAIIRPKHEIEPEGWRKSVALDFRAGAHEIEFIAQGKRQDLKAGLTWVPPGETLERHMTSADFSPAPRAAIRGLTSADRSRYYALVRIERLGKTGFFSTTRLWARLHSLSGEANWHIGEEQIEAGKVNICARQETPLTMTFAGDKLDIELRDKNFRQLGGEIGVVTELPQVLYAEERLNGDVTMLSEAEIPLDAQVRLAHLRGHQTVGTLVDEALSLQGRGARMISRSQPTGRNVVPFELAGKDLHPKDTFHLFVRCAPEIFADEAIRICAPVDCAGVHCDEGGKLVNAEGERVVIRLTRPSLSDKRRWGLLRSIASATKSINRLMVVASPHEWGDRKFVTALEVAAKDRGIELQLATWANGSPASSRMLGSIGAVAQRLESSDADAIVLIPPLADLADGVVTRDLSRAAACLAEMSSSHAGRQQVWLALPPSYRPDAPRSESFEQGMLEVVNDYGINAIPLGAWLETRPEKLARAYTEEGMLKHGPVGMHQTIADYLITWISGGAK